ncbi:MAG: hypothetical protein H7222_12220 [Methylotenera sp.]|nr:hypothetical protein [Oligoflexia bacterium]
MSVAEWYLVVEGTKTGPYTPEQIAGLLQEGEILAHHRATSDRLNGDSISVKELVTAFQKAVSDSFKAPPRPSEIDSASTIVPPIPEGQDTTQNLFDALKAAKEKQQGTQPSKNHAASLDVTHAARRANELKPQIVLIIVLGVAFCVAVFALTRLLRSETPVADNKAPGAPRSTAPVQNRNTAPQATMPLNTPVQSRVPPRTLPRNAAPANPRFPPGGGAIRQGENDAPSRAAEEARELRDRTDRREAESREREHERDDLIQPAVNAPSVQDEASALQRPHVPDAGRRELPPGAPVEPGAQQSDPGTPEGVAPDARTQ